VKGKPLTAEELAAIQFAKTHGGIIQRHPHGWGAEDFDLSNAESIFGNGTVKGLVSRGLMRWSLHERRGGAPVPIEAEVAEGAR
jgi:hypothetical protein